MLGMEWVGGGYDSWLNLLPRCVCNIVGFALVGYFNVGLPLPLCAYEGKWCGFYEFPFWQPWFCCCITFMELVSVIIL